MSGSFPPMDADEGVPMNADQAPEYSGKCRQWRDPSKFLSAFIGVPLSACIGG
jgi:hypothetical protein